MSLQQIKFTTTQTHAEHLSDLLLTFGAVSVTFLDAEDQPIYEPLPDTTPLWDQINIVALFDQDENLTSILQFLQNQIDTPLNYELQTVNDDNWTQAWQTHFQPMYFPPRLWICSNHHVIDDVNAVKVLLEPGLAFGTGTHPTTALCLEWIAQHIHSDKTMVDYGCGSGILALAALKLGAKQVWAIDNDPQALTACQQNAQNNQIADLILGAPDDFPQLNPSIIVANILANPLIELAPKFSSWLSTGDKLVLSGILAHQANAVMRVYQTHFEFKTPVTKEEWVRLEGIKK
jgi:ribosomal protein L11 methyltransferase